MWMCRVLFQTFVHDSYAPHLSNIVQPYMVAHYCNILSEICVCLSWVIVGS